MQHAKARLRVIIPITLFLIFLILYLNTKSLIKTAIVLLAVPFSLVGAVWLLYLLGYNWSIAVWVGLIALAGLDAETGVVMLLYLDIAFEQWQREGQHGPYADLAEAVDHGAVQRIRPKMMTVMAILLSLVPILWATGTGRGRDAADRRPDGGWSRHVVHRRADRLSVDLFHLARAEVEEIASLPSRGNAVRRSSDTIRDHCQS